MAIRRLRSPLAAGVVASVLPLALGAWTLASRAEPPEVLADLERAQAAAGEARSHSQDLVADLEAIATNLEPGFLLRERTGQIHALTEKQARSLRQLGDLLQRQIDELGLTVARLRDTRATAASIRSLSSDQAHTLRESISALRRLQSYARSSSAVSADLARFARYGARLAEDSREALSNP